jgi:hypothetical protein
MTAPPDHDEPSQLAFPEPLSTVRAAALGNPSPLRSWTPLGTVDAGAIAEVDGAGMVRMRGADWSLDWWVGAEDRWHHPSVEAAVRQSSPGDAPVTETAMRVPGGDVVHRAYAVRASSPGDGDQRWEESAVVVEVENLTSVPVALAFVVRPVTLDDEGRIDMVESDGPVVRVDGRVAMVLTRAPARAAHGPLGEPAGMLERGDDVDGVRVMADARDGSPEVAFVIPLTHSATARVMLPRVVAPQRRRLLRRAPARPSPGADWEAPGVDPVMGGWEAHTRAAARVELPEPLLGRVVTASERTLTIAATDGFLGEVDLGEVDLGDPAALRAAWTCEALVRSGVTEPLGPLARALVASQRLNGEVRLADGSDATVALVHAAAALLHPSAPGWVEDLLGPVAKSVHRLGKGAGHGGGSLAVSAVEALERLAPALRSIEQPDVADEAVRVARSIELAADDSTDAATVASEVAVLRRRLRAADRDAVGALIDLARAGTPGALPDELVDGIPTGRMGFDPAAVANRLSAVLDSVLIEGTEGPVLLRAWPSSWWGQGAEVHGVRTRWGTAAFALRWHGERPAVLWEIESAGPPAGPPPVLTAPALDPSWRATGWVGEALLSPVAAPADLVPATSTGGGSPAPEPGAAGAPAEGESFS